MQSPTEQRQQQQPPAASSSSPSTSTPSRLKDESIHIKLDDCFNDTPDFRARVTKSEQTLLGLEGTIKQLLKLTYQSIELQSDYSDKTVQFSDHISALAKSSDDQIEGNLVKFSEVFREIERSRGILLTHLKEVFIDPTEKFLKNEIGGMKKCSKDFQSSSDQYDSVLGKYMSKKIKDMGIMEQAEDVATVRRAMHRKSVEFCAKLNEVQMRKKFELIETVVAMVYTHFAFFHQGYELLKDLEPSMRELSGYLNSLRTEFNKQDRVDTESVVQNTRPELYNPQSAPTTLVASRDKKQVPSKCGYLFKKSSQKMRNAWHRRYFELSGDTLFYYSTKEKDSDDGDVRVGLDLRVCMVREVQQPERRFCFEVVSPNRTYTLQAENEFDMFEWISIIQNAIARALHLSSGRLEGNTAGLSKQPSLNNFDESSQTPSSPNNNNNSSQSDQRNQQPPAALSTTSNKQQSPKINQQGGSQPDTSPLSNTDILPLIRQVTGNDICADCSQPDPEWASTNLGITLCITCSGIHRGLGRHISKVRSLTLDRWEPESLMIMKVLGNEQVNKIFEANLKNHKQKESVKPSSGNSRTDKERWIMSKYVEKVFVWDEVNTKEFVEISPHSALYEAIGSRDVPRALKCLALGADINWKHPDSLYTPLHQSIMNADIAMTEFLLLWCCEVNVIDSHGMTPLHHAVLVNNSNLVTLLVRRHCQTDIKDNKGRTPLDLALEQSQSNDTYAQIVTILRLTIFNNENNSTTKWQINGFAEAMKSVGRQESTNSILGGTVTSPTSLSKQNSLYSPADPDFVPRKHSLSPPPVPVSITSDSTGLSTIPVSNPWDTDEENGLPHSTSLSSPKQALGSMDVFGGESKRKSPISPNQTFAEMHSAFSSSMKLKDTMIPTASVPTIALEGGDEWAGSQSLNPKGEDSVMKVSDSNDAGLQ